MNFDKIEKILANEPKFRAKQVKQLIWRDLIEDWDKALTLPIELRERLKKECPLEIKAEVFPDKDGKSVKALIILADGLSVETVLMRHEKGITPSVSPPSKGGEGFYFRNTVCVSSQIGCPLGCVFCATGKAGFKRNLSYGEIVEQALFWARYHRLRGFETDNADNEDIHPFNPQKISAIRGINNIVFMGMGEPFLNYDNVFEAIKILNDDNLLGIGARHISISTVGIIEGIERMVEDMPQINLAISLHAPNDELRQKLMPIDKKYPLAAVMAAAKDYVAKTNRKLMFEYIMIKGINDSTEHAKELAKLLNNRLFFVNLIAYNPTGDFTPLQNLQSSSNGTKESKKDFATGFIPSEPVQIKKFKDVLMKAGLQALERYRFGQDIKGACGQLSNQ